MQTIPEITLSLDREQELKMVEDYIKGQAIGTAPLQILEAGCGRQWPIKLYKVDYVLTGVDLDKDALEVRKNTKKDLHEIIEGDLRTVALELSKYDVVFNAFVLEHVKGAETVLRNFVKWLKPGGIIILRIPDPRSVRGFTTGHTPFWLHVFYHKYILRRPNAGQMGYGPYETYYDPVVSRGGIREFCNDNHLIIRVERGDGYHSHGSGIVRFLISIGMNCVSALSFGALSAKHSNLLYILQKPLSVRA